MSPKFEIDHIELYVRDLELSLRWYKNIFGYDVRMRWEPHPVMIGNDNVMLALFIAREDGPDNSDDDSQPPIRIRRIAWRVSPDSFQQAQDHLENHRVEFTGPIDHTASESIYFNDPDGHPLEITCYGK